MKKQTICLLISFIISLAANAQDKDIPSPVSIIGAKTLLEVGVDVHKAIGNLDKIYGIGGGINAGINRRLNNNFSAIGRVGYTILQGDKIPGIDRRYETKSLIRALGEIEVVKGPTGPVFGRATGGLVLVKTKSSDMEASFMYGVTAGYRFKASDKSLLSIGLSYHSFKFNDDRYGYLSLRTFVDFSLR